MKKIFLFFCNSLLLTQIIQAQVSGVKTIPGDYNSITDAISQIRIAGVSGPTFLELQPGYNSATETFPITIRSIPGTSAVNSVTISPAAGATGLSIISASSGPVINLIGAYNIIIDGRPGRTGNARELTIRNNAEEGNAVSFVDGAVENIVTWCILEGRHIPDVGGVISFGRSNEPIPDGIFLENSGNELSNSIVRIINHANITIYSEGGDPVYNSGNRIINNEITGFHKHGILTTGFNSGWTITGNSFYNPDDPFFSSLGMSVIGFGAAPAGSAINNTISGNFIGGQTAGAGGAKWNANYIWGIKLEAGSFIVENNIIQNFNLVEGGGGNEFSLFYGISVTNGASAVISGNLIGGSPATNGDIIMTADKIKCTGIVSGSCSFVSITNNKIGNFTLLANISSQFIGIASTGASNPVITGNEIDGLNNTSTGLIDFKAILLRPDASCQVIPGPTVVDHNLINNITLSSDGDDASFTGIEIAGASSESLLLHYNEIYKINVSSPNAAANFAGFSINDRISANTGNVIGSATEANSIMITGKTVNASAILVNASPDASISDDIIGNITVNGTLSATLKGIDILGGGKANVTGNELKNLSVSSSGLSDMQAIIFSGVVTGSELSALHNNQVYKINVSSSDGEASFAGIRINDRISANNANVIGSPTEANSIMVTGKSASANGIRINNSADVSISDDIIANITANGTLDPGSVNGILFEGGLVVKIDSNNIHHLTAPVSRGIFIQPGYGTSTVTVEKNILTGLNTTTGKGIETFVTSEASLNLIATDNTVSNWQTGVLLAAATGATFQQTFQNNSVVANQTGFINNIGAPVNATCNWWGDASGPSGAGPGTGNPVGPNVIFSPWATISTYVAVNAGPDQTITGSGSKTLTPTYTVCGTATYLWSTGATAASITVSPTVTTVYTIKVNDANGHEATDEVTVFVVPGLTVNVGPDQIVCNGSVVTLTANINGQNTNGPPPPTAFSISGTSDQLILKGNIEYVAIGNTMSQSEDRTNCNKNSSSSKTLIIPAGAAVKMAWLYWSGSGSTDNTVKLNGTNVNAQNTKTHSRSGGFTYFGARAEVTGLVQSSGNYIVSDLSWSNGSPYCYDNSAYGAWALVVVYEQAALPAVRIHINTEKFKFTFPAGAYTSSIGGINLPAGCTSNARLTIIAFEGDNYKGEGLTIGGQNFGDNNFRGQSGPNLDILSWNIPTLVTAGNSSLNYSINSYQSNTVFGPAIEGLFDYVKVLKYNICPAPCTSVSYLWNTGAATQSINLTQPGTYSVQVTDCAGFIAKDTVIVTACPPFDPNKCYKLVARHSGKVLEIAGNSTANGGNAKQQAFANGNNQKWKFEAIETDYYKLINVHSEKSLEVKNSGTSTGADIQQWTWEGTDNQKWNLAKNTAGYYVIKAKHSGKVMEVKNSSTSNGAPIQQGGSSGSGQNQQWTVSETGCPNINARTLAPGYITTEAETIAELNLTVQPNPTSYSYFNLVIKSNDDKLPVSVRVTDISGKVVTVLKTGPNTTLRLGENWTSGIYFAEVIQGDQRKVVKMIKVN